MNQGVVRITSPDDALSARVDVHRAIAYERGQSEVHPRSEVDGERACRRNAGHDGDAGDDGFLHDLEAGAPADRQDATAGGQRAAEGKMTYHLVDRVVTPDVFAQREEPTLEVEERRGMDATGAREKALLAAELGHEARQRRGRDGRRVVEGRAARCEIVDG